MYNRLSSSKPRNKSKEKDYGGYSGEIDKNVFAKENNWNNRFHLDKLSNYNLFKDKDNKSTKKIRNQLKFNIKQYQYKPSNDDVVFPQLLEKPIAVIKKETEGLDEKANKILSNYSDDFNIIHSMWDDLGVNPNYRTIFTNVAVELDVMICKEFLDFEINSLKKYAGNLSKLVKEIEAREKSISMLVYYCETLTESDVTDKVLNDIVQILKNLRIISINIINSLSKLRENCSYLVLGSKYDLEKLGKDFSFDRNYLLKMKNDLDFLKTTILSRFFNFSSGSDPFLISLSEEQKRSTSMITIPIKEDVLKFIKNSQFLILQDIIIFEVSNLAENELASDSIKSPKTGKIRSATGKNKGGSKEKQKSSRPGSAAFGKSSTSSGFNKLEANVRLKFNEYYDYQDKNRQISNNISPLKNSYILVNNQIKPINTSNLLLYSTTHVTKAKLDLPKDSDRELDTKDPIKSQNIPNKSERINTNESLTNLLDKPKDVTRPKPTKKPSESNSKRSNTKIEIEAKNRKDSSEMSVDYQFDLAANIKLTDKGKKDKSNQASEELVNIGKDGGNTGNPNLSSINHNKNTNENDKAFDSVIEEVEDIKQHNNHNDLSKHSIYKKTDQEIQDAVKVVESNYINSPSQVKGKIEKSISHKSSIREHKTIESNIEIIDEVNIKSQGQMKNNSFKKETREKNEKSLIEAKNKTKDENEDKIPKENSILKSSDLKNYSMNASIKEEVELNVKVKDIVEPVLENETTLFNLLGDMFSNSVFNISKGLSEIYKTAINPKVNRASIQLAIIEKQKENKQSSFLEPVVASVGEERTILKVDSDKNDNKDVIVKTTPSEVNIKANMSMVKEQREEKEILGSIKELKKLETKKENGSGIESEKKQLTEPNEQIEQKANRKETEKKTETNEEKGEISNLNKSIKSEQEYQKSEKQQTQENKPEELKLNTEENLKISVNLEESNNLIKLKEIDDNNKNLDKSQFKPHYQTFNSELIDDVSDAHITITHHSKKDAEESIQESKYKSGDVIKEESISEEKRDKSFIIEKKETGQNLSIIEGLKTVKSEILETLNKSSISKKSKGQISEENIKLKEKIAEYLDKLITQYQKVERIPTYASIDKSDDCIKEENDFEAEKSIKLESKHNESRQSLNKEEVKELISNFIENLFSKGEEYIPTSKSFVSIKNKSNVEDLDKSISIADNVQYKFESNILHTESARNEKTNRSIVSIAAVRELVGNFVDDLLNKGEYIPTLQSQKSCAIEVKKEEPPSMNSIDQREIKEKVNAFIDKLFVEYEYIPTNQTIISEKPSIKKQPYSNSNLNTLEANDGQKKEDNMRDKIANFIEGIFVDNPTKLSTKTIQRVQTKEDLKVTDNNDEVPKDLPKITNDNQTLDTVIVKEKISTFVEGLFSKEVIFTNKKLIEIEGKVEVSKEEHQPLNYHPNEMLNTLESHDLKKKITSFIEEVINVEPVAAEVVEDLVPINDKVILAEEVEAETPIPYSNNSKIIIDEDLKEQSQDYSAIIMQEKTKSQKIPAEIKEQVDDFVNNLFSKNQELISELKKIRDSNNLYD